MHYLTIINYTAAAEEGTDVVFRLLGACEMMCLVVSVVVMLVSIYLLNATNQYHPNVSHISTHFAVQYVVQIAARIVILSMNLASDDTEALLASPVFQMANTVRLYCLMIAFYIMTCFVGERVLATRYIRDYETRQRRYIPWLFLPITYGLCAVSYYLFSYEIVEVWIICVFIQCLNVFSIWMNRRIECLNESLYYCTCNSSWYTHFIRPKKSASNAYSLSERFQIAENYRLGVMLHNVFIAIAIFNLGLASLLLAKTWQPAPNLANAIYTAHDMGAILYGLTVPTIGLYHNVIWQKTLTNMWRRWKNEELTDDGKNFKSNLLRDLHGNAMLIQKCDEQERYFSQLRSTWRTPKLSAVDFEIAEV